MTTCVMCPNELSGRQTRYCSPTCSATSFNQARIADGRLRDYRARNREHAAAYAAARRRGGTGLPLAACAACGGPTGKALRIERRQVCGSTCRSYLRFGEWPHSDVSQPKQGPSKPPLDPRRPLRKAWESQDWDSVQAELLARTEDVTPSGCRNWKQRVNTDGYPRVTIGKKRYSAYRVMAYALRRGDMMVAHVHHVCANRRCIEPTHLQVVTPESNTAEMLHRGWYVARIAELEAALHDLAPEHPALTALPLGLSA